MIKRRRFLQGLLGLVAAPAVINADKLMRVFVPVPHKKWLLTYKGMPLTPEQINQIVSPSVAGNFVEKSMRFRFVPSFLVSNKSSDLDVFRMPLHWQKDRGATIRELVQANRPDHWHDFVKDHQERDARLAVDVAAVEQRFQMSWPELQLDFPPIFQPPKSPPEVCGMWRGQQTIIPTWRQRENLA